jgi:intracellular sulfur oxidation DsrE/DsrF family protein
MTQNHEEETNPRRGFLEKLAAGTTALGLAALAAPFHLDASPLSAGDVSEADAWFSKVKGKHKMIFDATQPHEIMPFAWPKIFMLTNAATGTPESECGVVVVLRHSAIGYAFDDRIWAKYNFAEVFKAGEIGPAFQAADAATAAKTRNPFWKPKPGDFKVPGVGAVEIGINELQSKGVMFCVCNMAIGVYTNVLAEGMKMTPEEVRKDWLSSLLPGIQVVPSGVWAVGRAQERGCTYCFAG